MDTDLLSEDVIVRYLLGELPEEDAAQLEERAFADPQYAREVLAVECDLIDEYVRGGLLPTQRRQFESRFLASAERRRKVDFARALARVPSSTDSRADPAPASHLTWWEGVLAFVRGPYGSFQLAGAAAALVLLLGMSWLIADRARLRQEVAQLQAAQQTQQREEEALRQQADRERTRSAQLASQLEAEQRRATEAAGPRRGGAREGAGGPRLLALLFLPPGISRSGAERPELVLPSAAVPPVNLQIGLEPEDNFARFAIELKTVAGREVFARAGLDTQQSGSGRVLDVIVPSGVLGAGRYELLLKAETGSQRTEDVRYYYFDVTIR